MSQEWYNQIAISNGGYKSDAKYIRKGLSGEIYFENELKRILPKTSSVLDIGCGHGEFTLEMSKYCQNIVGGDNAEELLKIANHLKDEGVYNNVEFSFAWTKGTMPFDHESFDLIYSRRGPTSIVKYGNLLKPGGLLIGIHTVDLDWESYKVKLENNGFTDIQLEVFDQAYYVYENEVEFAKHISSMHMQKNYLLQEHQDELRQLIKENMRDGQITWPEHRYVWRARRL